MKWRSTVALLAVACGFGLYLYFFERTRPAKTERGEEKRQLFQLSADDIDRLRVTQGEVTVTLERESAPKGATPPSEKEPTWRVTEPVAARASAMVSDQIARDLASLDWESRLAGGAQDSEKVKERGLAEPRATLTFRHQGKEETLEFGDDTPLGDRVYLRRRGGADLYEVRKSVLTSLPKGVDGFRDTTVLPFTAADVKKFSISRGGEHLVAERTERRWQLLEPFPAAARGDREKLDEVLKKLNGLRVEQFVDDTPQMSPEALTRYGLATPVLAVELEAGGKSLSLSFGAAVPEHPDWRYARTAEGPSVYAVRADAAESLARPFLEFRDRRLSSLTADRVETITVTLAPTGAAEAGARETAAGAETKGGEAAGRASPEKPETPAGEAQPPAGASQPAAASPPAAVSQPAAVASPVQPQTVELVRKQAKSGAPRETEAAWRVTKPRDIDADEDAVRELLRDVDSRTVLDFVDFPKPPEAGDLAAYGLDKPRATLNLAATTGEREAIEVGSVAAEGGRLYLRRDEEPTVLAVNGEFGRLALRGYLAYRTKKLTEVKREDVTHIRIERPSGTVELTKEKNDWQLVTPIKKRAERTAVDDLLFELGPLHAESIVAEEVTDFSPYGLDKPAYRLEVEAGKEGDKPVSTVVSLGAEAPEGGRFVRLAGARQPDAGAREAGTGLVATLPLRFVDRLDAEFRQRTVFTLERDKVEELTLKGVTPEVDAVKVSGVWQLRQPEGQPLDEAKVNGLLDELKSLRVERWVTYEATDMSPYGLDTPVAVVSVRLSGLESQTHTVAFGTEAQSGDVFARVEGDPGVFLLPKRLLEKVQGSLLVQPQAEPAPAEPNPEGQPAPAPASGQAPADGGPGREEASHPELGQPQGAPTGPPSPPAQTAPSPGE